MPRKTCSSSSSSRTNHYYDTMGTNVQRSSSITHSLIEQRGCTTHFACQRAHGDPLEQLLPHGVPIVPRHGLGLQSRVQKG
jgi:hypothetical protein